MDGSSNFFYSFIILNYFYLNLFCLTIENVYVIGEFWWYFLHYFLLLTSRFELIFFQNLKYLIYRLNLPANGFCEWTSSSGECRWRFSRSDPTSTGLPDCAETSTRNRSTTFTGGRMRKPEMQESPSNRSTSLWNGGGNHSFGFCIC